MKKEDFLKEQESFDNEILSEKDMEIYALIFKELNADNSLEIPMDFSICVAKKSFKRHRLREDIILYAFYSVLFITLLLIAFLFFSIGSSESVRRKENLIPFFGYGIAGALVYFLIQSLERWLLEK